MTTNDESFLLTLCRHKTLGSNLLDLSGKVLQQNLRLKINLQFRFSPTTPERAADATAPTRSVLQLRIC